MKRLSRGGTVCAVAVMAAALIVGVWSRDVSADPTTDYVIVVSIDGLRCYEAFHSAPGSDRVVCMRDSLSDYGTLYTNLWNRGVTQTLGGHTTIATGSWQLMPNSGTFFGWCEGDETEDKIGTQPDIPGFFEYYNKANSYLPDSNKTFYVGGKSWNDTIACSVDPEFGRSYGANVVIYPPYPDPSFPDSVPADTATYRVLLETLSTYHPHLVLVNFKDVDGFGHSNDWSDYTTAVETADSLVWNLWKWLQAEWNTFYRNKTTLIVTTDHGRHDIDAHGGFKGHSGICHGCRHLFCLIAGPSADIKQDQVSSSHVDQIDICPTVGELLGFYYPKARGRPLAEALDFDPAYMVGTNYGAGNDNVRVSDTDSISVSPYIVSSSTGDTLHVVYVDKSTGEFRVKYARSTNSGTSFPDTATLSYPMIDAQCPSLCAIGDTLYVTWMECKWHQASGCDSVPRWYLYYRKSTSAGDSWADTTKIAGSVYETSSTPSLSIWDPVVNYDFDSVIGIAVRYGVWRGQNRVGCFRSTNGGTSWSLSLLDDDAWLPLHCDIATEADEAYPWAFGTWYDIDTLRTEISGNCWYVRFARSSNAGAHWLAHKDVYKDSTYVADPTIDTDLPYLVASFAVFDSGTWQTYFSRSINTGEDWSDGAALSTAGDGAIDPELILGTDDYFWDFWAEYDNSSSPVDAHIIYSYSTNQGYSWQPQDTLSAGQSYSLRPSVCEYKGVVWEDYRHGNWEIYFDSPE